MTTATSPTRLLLIEDNAGDALLVADLLENISGETFHIDLANRLDVAQKRITENEYKCLLVDLTLPDASGAEIVDHLRQGAPDSGIVVLTGRADLETSIETVRMGADDYLVKQQLQTDGLRRAIHNAIERRTIRRDLERSERRFQQVIETASDAFVSIDASGNITGWNTRAESTFGWRRNEVMGRPIFDLLFPIDSSSVTREEFENFITNGDGPAFEKRIEIDALQRDGTRIPVEFTIWKSEHDVSASFNAFFTDISERRAAQKLKDQFLAFVSHELRAPLTTIVAYLELLVEAEHERLSESGKEFISIMGRSSQRLLRLIGDLLFVAQAEAGTMKLIAGPVDLPQLVADAYSSTKVKGEEKGLEVSRSIDKNVPIYIGDADRLAQAVDNLVTNALKFTPTGGRVNVGLSATSSEVLIEVTDSGPGIAPDDQQQLFEPFARATSATMSKIPGVGLGLAITHAIVEGHHGEIDVESVVGQGTTFRIRLPIRHET